MGGCDQVRSHPPERRTRCGEITMGKQHFTKSDITRAVEAARTSDTGNTNIPPLVGIKKTHRPKGDVTPWAAIPLLENLNSRMYWQLAGQEK